MAIASDDEVRDLIWDVPEEDILSETYYADNEIRNGGFFQYYSNSIFDAKKHIADLRKLDFIDLADIVQRSLDCFPNSEQPRRFESDIYPISDRVLSLIGSRDCFYGLEDEYYRICDKLDAHFIRYLRTHSEDYWKILHED